MPAVPDVTVVIPTHNRCDLLRETVTSILAQTHQNWELVIVDDASEDGTWDWLKSLDDPRILSIRSDQHSERDRCRNIGLASAHGEFITFLDDDDLLTRNAMALHLTALRQNPEAIASIGGFVVFDEAGARWTTRIVCRMQTRDIWEDVIFGWSATGGQSLMRVCALRAIGGWNEAYRVATDHELWSRLARQGRVILQPAITLEYRVHERQWRPPNMEQLMFEVRKNAVERLSGAPRGRAESALEARQLVIRAYEHYLAAEAFQALRLYLAAFRRMPFLLNSPLRRSMVVRPILKCMVGKLGLQLFRPVVNRSWRFRQKRITISGNLAAENDGRWHDPHRGDDFNEAAGGSTNIKDSND